MHLHNQPNPEVLSEVLAEWITNDIAAVLEKQDRYTFVLTGGNSPKQLYDLLAQPAYSDRINWEKVHIFWGDERAVPFTDDRNNARMTFEHLLNKIPVVKEQVYLMRTDIEPAAAALEYEQLLHQYFDGQEHSFDLVLNGMGDDGHTLSLFPGTAVIHEQERWVTAYYLEPQSMYRITLTAPVVNEARKVAFLAFGAKKADALQQVLEGKYNPDLYPSQVIKPAHGEVHWFVDEEAANKLNKQ